MKEIILSYRPSFRARPISAPAAPIEGPPARRYEESPRNTYTIPDIPQAQLGPRTIDPLFAPENGSTLSTSRARSRARTQHVTTEEEPDSHHSTTAVLTAQRSRRSNPPSPGSPPAYSYSARLRPRISFYHKHDPYYGFTNFSPHTVKYKRKVYPTSEHLFQSFKFQDHRDDLAEHIRLCSPHPGVAFSEARRFPDHVRPDWKQVNISKMEEALYCKFTQHDDLRAELLETGDAELVEESDKDSFWGVGADGRGSNELGKALERLRTRFRREGRI